MPREHWNTFLNRHRVDSKAWRGKNWSRKQVMRRVARAWNDLNQAEKATEISYIQQGTGLPRTLAQLYPPPASIPVNPPFGPANPAPGVAVSAVAPPGIQQAAMQQPAMQQPAMQQPAMQQPAMQQPAVQQPPAQPPSAQQPTQRVAHPPAVPPHAGPPCSAQPSGSGSPRSPQQAPPSQSAGDDEEPEDRLMISEPLFKANNVSDSDLPRDRQGDDGFYGNGWRGMWNLIDERNHLHTAVQVDNESIVQRRLITKDVTNLEDFQYESWKDEKRWHVQPGESQANRQPMEFALQQRMHERCGRYVAKVLACSVRNNSKAFRLYFDYCDQGNASNLIDRYKKAKRKIPEPLLWHIFESLAIIALVMMQGSVDEPVPGWKEIVHRDLTPGNVLLHFEEHDNYPAYPVPKLTDFEFAMESSPDDKDNPRKFYLEQAGQPGYKAPEAGDGSQPESQNETKMLSHTNVWGIGAILLSLMNLEVLDVYDLNPTLSEEADGYSEQLKDLVTRCMRDNPKGRPQVDKLLADIKKCTGDEIDLTGGLRSNATPQDDAMVWGYIRYEDPYPLGEHFSVLQARREEIERQKQRAKEEQERELAKQDNDVPAIGGSGMFWGGPA